VQFGRPIGTFQMMQAKLAELYAACNASRAYAYSVARACDAGRTTRYDAAACLLVASERATQAGLEAIQMLGGNGYINDYPAGRILRDAKLYEIGAGTNEIRRMLIGRELFRRRLEPELHNRSIWHSFQLWQKKRKCHESARRPCARVAGKRGPVGSNRQPRNGRQGGRKSDRAVGS
jgi:hypothetical protein